MGPTRAYLFEKSAQPRDLLSNLALGGVREDPSLPLRAFFQKGLLRGLDRIPMSRENSRGKGEAPERRVLLFSLSQNVGTGYLNSEVYMETSYAGFTAQQDVAVQSVGKGDGSRSDSRQTTLWQDPDWVQEAPQAQKEEKCGLNAEDKPLHGSQQSGMKPPQSTPTVPQSSAQDSASAVSGTRSFSTRASAKYSKTPQKTLPEVQASPASRRSSWRRNSSSGESSEKSRSFETRQRGRRRT